jgi:putative spermidine/putrescine transport system permease protein
MNKSGIQFTTRARLLRLINKLIIVVWRPLYLALVFVACLYLIIPTVVITLASVSNTSYVTFPPQGVTLKWYANFVTRPGFTDSLFTSVLLAVVIALLSVAASVFLSVMIGRRAGVIQTWTLSLTYLPLLLPTIVYGPALMLWTYRLKLGQTLLGTYLSLGAAHLILALPFALQSIIVGYERMDVALEEAALVMGARPPTVFRRVTLPLLMPAIIAGLTFGFLISFDEPVVALFFTRADFVTLPVRMFQYLRYKPDPTIAAIATIMTFVSMGLVVVADRLIGLDRLMGLRKQ